jgi:hypothetical protein
MIVSVNCVRPSSGSSWILLPDRVRLLFREFLKLCTGKSVAPST